MTYEIRIVCTGTDARQHKPVPVLAVRLHGAVESMTGQGVASAVGLSAGMSQLHLDCSRCSLNEAIGYDRAVRIFGAALDEIHAGVSRVVRDVRKLTV